VLEQAAREWCYAATYQSSNHCAQARTAWLDYYNTTDHTVPLATRPRQHHR